MTKQKVVIFEGVDKSGKSSLLGLLNKRNNYSYWALDRSIVSCVVYDKIFNRPCLETHELILDDLINAFDCKFILCCANSEVIKERLKEYKEELCPELQNIDKVYDIFNETLVEHNANFITLHTDEMTMSTCMQIIEDFIGD